MRQSVNVERGTRLRESKKMTNKQHGLDKPDIKIVQHTKDNFGLSNRTFSRSYIYIFFFTDLGMTEILGCLVVLNGIKFSVSHACFSAFL